MPTEESRPGNRAYHLKRQAEEARRAERSIDPSVRRVHLALAGLHAEQACSDSAAALLMVPE